MAIQGEGDPEPGPAPRAVLHPDGAAVDLDDGAADGQPQTDPAVLAAVVRVVHDEGKAGVA